MVRKAREVPGPSRCLVAAVLALTTGLRQDLPKQDCPADEGVATLANARLHRQFEVAGSVDEAADFAGRPGDIDQRHVPATGVSWVAMRLAPRGPGPAR